MPITVNKKKLTIESLVKRLFTAEEVAGTPFSTMADMLVKGNAVLKTSPSQLSLTAGGKPLAVADVKLSGLQMAMKGQLSYVAKKALKAKIKDFFSAAYASLLDKTEADEKQHIYKETMAAYHKNGKKNKVAAIKQYRVMTGASLKEAKDQVEVWISQLENEVVWPEVMESEWMGIDPAAKADLPKGKPLGELLAEKAEEIGGGYGDAVANAIPGEIEPLTEKHIKKAMEEIEGAGGVQQKTFKGTSTKPIELEKADKLHQPVFGTSTGSIYHVIALGKHANVAVRIKKGNDIAIRVAPFNVEARSACAAAGLDAKNGGSHYSIHLHPDSESLVNKTVGAVLFAMGLSWDAVATNPMALMGAGK